MPFGDRYTKYTSLTIILIIRVQPEHILKVSRRRCPDSGHGQRALGGGGCPWIYSGYEGLVNRLLIKYSVYVFKRYPAPSPADSLNFNAQTCDVLLLSALSLLCHYHRLHLLQEPLKPGSNLTLSS